MYRRSQMTADLLSASCLVSVRGMGFGACGESKRTSRNISSPSGGLQNIWRKRDAGRSSIQTGLETHWVIREALEVASRSKRLQHPMQTLSQ